MCSKLPNSIYTTLNFKCSSKKQSKVIAQSIANTLNIGDVVCLYGDLGVGKTTFTQFILNKLIIKETRVTSPTFNLVNQYQSKNFTIWHFDFYRLNNVEEIYNLGLEDAFKYGVSIIEWPELIQNILPKNNIKIYLDFSTNKNKRNISITLSTNLAALFATV